MIFPEVTPVPDAPEGTDLEVTETDNEPTGADLTGTPVETDTESEGGTTDEADLFELKVDGQTLKLKKDELITRAQKAIAAEKRMQTAAKERQDALRLIELAKSDPLAFLKHLDPNLNEKDFLSKRMAALMEEEMLSPEEKQHREDMRELQRLRDERKTLEEQRQLEELNQMAAAQQKVLDQEIAQAITEAGLPRTKAAVKRVAEYMLEATELGLDIPASKIAQQVKKDLQAEALELLNQSDEETFASLLGKDLLTKAQKAGIKQIKKPGNPVEPKPVTQKEPKVDKVDPADFLRAQGIF